MGIRGHVEVFQRLFMDASRAVVLCCYIVILSVIR